jgi:HEAT repeat protein
MLGSDAVTRETLQTENMYYVQRLLGIWCPDRLVPELIDRAEKAEDYVRDAYVIALARARDPRARELLMRTVKAEDHGADWLSMKFHSALGLAELDDPAGMEWLIAHCEGERSMLSFAPNRDLSPSAVIALRTLSGHAEMNTKAEFEAWWKTAAPTWTHKQHVYLQVI